MGWLEAVQIMQAGRLRIRIIPIVGLPGTDARYVNMFLGRDRPLISSPINC